MFHNGLVVMKFKVSLQGKKVVEKCLSSIRGNFSGLPLDEEMGQTLVMMARIVLSDYKPSEQGRN